VAVEFDFNAAPSGETADISQVQASGPAGVRVLASTRDPLNEFIVIAPTAGTIPLSVSWIQGGKSQCRGTGQVPLQMIAPKPTLVSFTKTSNGAWSGKFLGAFRRVRGGDASPLRVVVRSRRGTLSPPTAGLALLDTTQSMGAPISGVPERVELLDIRRHNVEVKLTLSGGTGNYEFSVAPRFPSSSKGFHLKFGLVVEAFQAGRRIGALSNGVSCGPNKSGGAYKGFKCQTSGLRKSP
jgi:hypothetical protein